MLAQEYAAKGRRQVCLELRCGAGVLERLLVGHFLLTHPVQAEIWTLSEAPDVGPDCWRLGMGRSGADAAAVCQTEEQFIHRLVRGGHPGPMEWEWWVLSYVLAFSHLRVTGRERVRIRAETAEEALAMRAFRSLDGNRATRGPRDRGAAGGGSASPGGDETFEEALEVTSPTASSACQEEDLEVRRMVSFKLLSSSECRMRRREHRSLCTRKRGSGDTEKEGGWGEREAGVGVLGT